MHAAIKGGLSGFIATLPMSAVMIFLHRRLPPSQKDPLPPRQITMRAAQKTGLQPKLSEPQKKLATVIGHFSYGSAMGFLYGALARRLRMNKISGGIAYGLAVWFASYVGYLPEIGLYRPVKREPPQRIGLMIAAHIVWGAALALSLHELSSSRSISSRTHAAV